MSTIDRYSEVGGREFTDKVRVFITRVIWFIKFLFNIKVSVPDKEILKVLNALKNSNKLNED